MNQNFHKCIGRNPIVTDELLGEVFCGSCGEVLKEKLVDISNETRTYTNEQYLGNARTGSPLKISIFYMGNYYLSSGHLIC